MEPEEDGEVISLSSLDEDGEIRELEDPEAAHLESDVVTIDSDNSGSISGGGAESVYAGETAASASPPHSNLEQDFVGAEEYEPLHQDDALGGHHLNYYPNQSGGGGPSYAAPMPPMQPLPPLPLGILPHGTSPMYPHIAPPPPYYPPHYPLHGAPTPHSQAQARAQAHAHAHAQAQAHAQMFALHPPQALTDFQSNQPGDSDGVQSRKRRKAGRKAAARARKAAKREASLYTQQSLAAVPVDDPGPSIGHGVAESVSPRESLPGPGPPPPPAKPSVNLARMKAAALKGWRNRQATTTEPLSLAQSSSSHLLDPMFSAKLSPDRIVFTYEDGDSDSHSGEKSSPGGDCMDEGTRKDVPLSSTDLTRRLLDEKEEASIRETCAKSKPSLASPSTAPASSDLESKAKKMKALVEIRRKVKEMEEAQKIAAVLRGNPLESTAPSSQLTVAQKAPSMPSKQPCPQTAPICGYEETKEALTQRIAELKRAKLSRERAKVESEMKCVEQKRMRAPSPAWKVPTLAEDVEGEHPPSSEGPRKRSRFCDKLKVDERRVLKPSVSEPSVNELLVIAKAPSPESGSASKRADLSHEERTAAVEVGGAPPVSAPRNAHAKQSLDGTLSRAQSSTAQKGEEEDSRYYREKLKSLSDESFILRSADVKYGRAEERLQHAKSNIALCRQRLTEALQEEAACIEETQTLKKVLRSIRHSFEESLKVVRDSGDGLDESEPDHSPTKLTGTPPASPETEKKPVGSSYEDAAESADMKVEAGSNPSPAIDFEAVSVLTPSVFTPNPLGQYRSPLGPSRSYVV